MNRRACLGLLAGVAMAGGAGQNATVGNPDSGAARDWVCPMDPDYRSTRPGVCPRCGMKLVANIPERLEYPLEVSYSPQRLRPGDTVNLTLRVRNPQDGHSVSHFETVHEKLMHLFLVSENLGFFTHVHPALGEDGCFRLAVKLPEGGMYRLLADYYPSGGVPQLSVDTLYVEGTCRPERLEAAVAPYRAQNLTASLRMEPEEPIGGLETRLFYTLDPADGLEPYLGAWAHMLAASGDLIDLMHLHPFLAGGAATTQFDIIFPRAGCYRIWTQFQRRQVVNTVEFTVPVKSL